MMKNRDNFYSSGFMNENPTLGNFRYLIVAYNQSRLL